MFKKFKEKYENSYIKDVMDYPMPVKGSHYIIGSFFFGSGLAYWTIWTIAKIVGLFTKKHYELMVTEV